MREALPISFHHPDRKALCVAQYLIGHAAAEDPFDPGRPMPPHYDGFVMSAARLFENISGNIVLMAELHRHVARVESGLCHRLARFPQDMALGFPFLPNPGFLLIAQLHAQFCLGGRTLRSAMLQQLPGHGFEHMKKGDGDIRCSAQERSNILDNAMGVLGLVEARRTRISASLEGRVERCSCLYTIPHEFADTRGGAQSESGSNCQKLERGNLRVGVVAL